MHCIIEFEGSAFALVRIMPNSPCYHLTLYFLFLTYILLFMHVVYLFYYHLYIHFILTYLLIFVSVMVSLSQGFNTY